MTTRIQETGQAQRPGGRPQAVEIVTDARPSLTSEEAASGLESVDGAYPAGNAKRYFAKGDGSTDDAGALQRMVDVWVQGVVSPNTAAFLPKGEYSIASSIIIEDSASQWVLSGEGRARSNEIQATTAVTGAMLQGTNVREATIERIGFKGNSGGKPSHGLKFDRDSGTQTGSGGPDFKYIIDCLFRNVDTGLEVLQSGGGNNDATLVSRSIFGQGCQYGIRVTNTNSAWTTFENNRFDTCTHADISNVVAQGESRGGSYVADKNTHVSGEICYEIGDCRNVTINAPRSEQIDSFIRTSGTYLEATDISVTGTNTINSAAGDLPSVSVGDVVWVRGLSVSAEDGPYRVTGSPSTSAIEVTDLDGTTNPLTNESAGGTIQFGTTRLLSATDNTNCSVNGGEVTTTGDYPIIWDGDSDVIVCSLSGRYNLVGGSIVCAGSATLIIGPGRYQVSELIVDDGVIILLPGAVFTAGTVTKTFWGDGRIINHGAIGGNIDDQVTWDPGSLADGAGELSAGITVNGARQGDHVQVFPPQNLQSMTVTGYVQTDDTVRIRIQNESGSTIDLASAVWHVRAFPPN